MEDPGAVNKLPSDSTHQVTTEVILYGTEKELAAEILLSTTVSLTPKLCCGS